MPPSPLYFRISRFFVLSYVFTLLLVINGSIIYAIEGEKNGFTTIPVGMYWSAATLATVGYGDLTPKTDLGKTFATLVMIGGYAILAVPSLFAALDLSEMEMKREEEKKTIAVSTPSALTPSSSVLRLDTTSRICIKVDIMI